MRLAALLSVSIALAATQAEAQARRVRGIVTDTAGYPLPNVEIRIVELGRLARTDVAGRFSIESIDASYIDLSARRLGYEMRFLRVFMVAPASDSVRVVMRPEPLLLGNVEVEERAVIHPFFNEYEKRRERGIGTFLTRKDIEELNTSAPSDAFRRLPGMKLVRAGSGMGVRFNSAVASLRRGGDCPPLIWIDGQPLPGMEIDDIRAGDIYGIEIYRGVSTTPVQFARAGLSQCGTIVVWTRRRLK